MKPFSRKASVLWRGTHQRGNGTISIPSGGLKKAPFGSGTDPGQRGTSPPELIAAAHAGSFSMTLAHELDQAGYRPSQIDTTATVTIEDIATGWRLTQIHLDVIAAVPNAAQCDFVDAALRAKANCPISRSLNVNISMRAHLNQRGAAAEQDRGGDGAGMVRKNERRRSAAKS